MMRLVIRGPEEEIARQFAEHLAERLTAALEAARAHAARARPRPGAVRQAAGQVPLSDPGARARRRASSARRCSRRPPNLKPPEDVQWIVDVDPLDML